ncbi:MAG: hypothetical protein ACRDM7_13605 [Thermoleophilaceae bacterium]
MSMWTEPHDFEAPAEPLLETAPLTVSAYAARIQQAVKRAGSAVVEGEVHDAPRLTPWGHAVLLADRRERLHRLQGLQA